MTVDVAPRPSGGRRRWVIIGIIAGVVLLVAGLVAWLVWPKGLGRDPFDKAVGNLAAAEAVTYRTSFAGLTMDTRVTKHGDSLGTMSLAGQRFELLGLGGHTYAKARTGLLPGSSGGAAVGLRNRWIASDNGLVGTGSQLAVAPATLAQRLATMVDQATGFDEATVGDVQAYVAHAPAGDLFVTRSEPHQVLRVAPRGGASPAIPNLPSFPSLPSLPSGRSYPSLPALPSLPDMPKLPGALRLPEAVPSAPPAAAAQLPAAMDVTAMPPQQVDDLYTDLASTAPELVEATDPNVQFTAQATGAIACGGACTVNATVTNTVAGKDVVESQVTAEMTATISVDGMPSGVCVSPPTRIPANGSGQVTCSDPESGAMAKALLQKKAAAAKGGVVSVTVTAQLEIQARAMTQVEVRQEVDRLRQQQQEARGSRAPPTYPPEGLKIGGVSLGTRQSGTTAPVRVDGLANPWRSPQDRLTIEAALGGNLPVGNRALDVYTAHDGGTAISIKTIDPRATSYRTSRSQILSEGRNQVNTLVHYRNGTDLWNPLVPPDAVSVWVLRLGYPASTTDPAILAYYQKILEYGQSKNIIVQLVPIIG